MSSKTLNVSGTSSEAVKFAIKNQIPKSNRFPHFTNVAVEETYREVTANGARVVGGNEREIYEAIRSRVKAKIGPVQLFLLQWLLGQIFRAILGWWQNRVATSETPGKCSRCGGPFPSPYRYCPHGKDEDACVP
jgi:hypothetical protein